MEERGRRSTLLDQMTVQTLNLGDFLQAQEEDPSQQRRTLGAVLKIEDARGGSQSLLDILNSEDVHSALRPGSKMPWKSFVHRLRHRRVAAAFACPPPARRPAGNESEHQPEQESVTFAQNSPPEEVASEGETIRRASMNLAAALAAERESSRATVEAEGSMAPATEVGTPVRMSLMALLEEADRPAMDDGPPRPAAAGVLREAEPGCGMEEAGPGAVERSCCVCMVRHRGAAFIPCGHTFCRACSRELWVSRGSCPLCNGFILEILDIF
ncbi:uncharacterized protein LOC116248847 [Nymphaea colorata]|uniref:uncharacterized protein LOC116248847 n=1 Tax=Nymphaea colorata TaxID=210225 RepID=UPI00129D37A2|nr:uncharacterized protein LOC116248847 [Nymphaea colorata]XP_031477712.1 uncharacterized protein LOC116248847 [Nymphaea colorata]XP_031477713.1 uncharacterized protein LOC116248847 [Nymphaea colorata]XP_031477714.1 uncharacterized protein LOC116248847 [Nymphaea colorata]